MAYIYSGIEDWSLKSAAKHLGISIERLLQHGASGEIRLSIRKPKGMKVWLVSLIRESSPKKYKDFSPLSDVFLLPSKIDVVHLNLSREDCRKLKVTRLQQCVFDSVYCPDGAGNLFDTDLLELVESDKGKMPSRLYKEFLQPEEECFFSDDSEYTLNLSEEVKNDPDYLKSLDAGLRFLRFPKVERLFALFNEELDPPLRGEDVRKVEIIDVEINDVFVPDIELQRFNIKKNTDLTIPVGEIEEGVWTSRLLAYLNQAALKSHPNGICQVRHEGNQTCIDQSPQVKQECLKQLAKSKAIVNEKSNYFKYFCYLTSCDVCFYSKEILEKSQEYLKNESIDVPPGIPTVLFAINKIAEKNYKDESSAKSKKVGLEYEFKKDLGFTGNLAKHAAKTVLISDKAAVK